LHKQRTTKRRTVAWRALGKEKNRVRVRLLPFKLEPLVSKPDEQQVAPLWRLENSAYADTFKILLSFRARALFLFSSRALLCTIILYCFATAAAVVSPL